MPRALAVITARGGSKGLARKNLRMLNGLPLLVHTIRAALDSDCFARVLVSTEDDEIARVSRAAGAAVLARPSELATDTASSLDVLHHALQANRCYAHYALLQPTSPLRTALHIREALALLHTSGAASCVSVAATAHPPHKCLVKVDDEYLPLFDHASLSTPRQLLPETYRLNGALYLGHVAGFLATRDLFAPRLVCYRMSERASLDIDTAHDLEQAERWLRESCVRSTVLPEIER